MAIPFRAAANVILERMNFMRRAGISFGGARDLYEVLGYDRDLDLRKYRDRYARGGIAARIVDALPNATWRGTVEIIEDEDPETTTPFEQAWLDLEQRLQLLAKLRRADILSGLSTYSVLLIGAPGDLSTQLPTGKSQEQILYFTPFYGGGGPGTPMGTTLALDADASIMEFEKDPSSPRFGLPTSYQLRRTSVSTPMLQRQVHWTRILHIAEGVLDDEVYGQPALERVWNLLDDLDKITGGGAEAFWLRANQGLHLNIDPTMTLPDAKGSVDALKEQAEEYKHQMTRWLRTRGVTANVLGSDVANFQGPADAILTQIAGAKMIPKRILTGSEMGELASSQDRDNWKDQITGRQTGYVGPYILRPLINRLVQFGYLPPPASGSLDYEVKWPLIQTLTEQEKSAGAQQWAGTTVNGAPVFLPEEIRDKWYGMDPLTPEQVEASKPEPKPEPAGGGFPFGKNRAAEEGDEEMLRVLEDAIRTNNTDVIDRVIGTEHSIKTLEAKPEDDLIRALATAIDTNDTATIDRLVGVRHSTTVSKRVEYDDHGRIARIIHEKGAVA